jgi:serine protease AprX
MAKRKKPGGSRGGGKAAPAGKATRTAAARVRRGAKKAAAQPSAKVRQAHIDATAAAGVAAEKRPMAQLVELRLDMMRSIVTEPLLSQVQRNRAGSFDVIISINELFQGGMAEAMKQIEKRADEWGVSYTTTSHYCFACLTGDQVLALADETRQLTTQYGKAGPVVYKIWEDTDVSVSLTRSLVTVKADAAQRAFQAQGDNIVWAVLDSGIQSDHPHFKRDQSPFGAIDSLNVAAPIGHLDFTPDGRAAKAVRAKTEGPEPLSDTTAMVDRFGHGTHVAGIIAGFWESDKADGEAVAGTEVRNEQTDGPLVTRDTIRRVSGVAPKCKLVSMKVIADVDMTGDVKQKAGQGKVSWVLMAIEQIQQWNQWGRRLLVHGVNMSLGYDFDPRWFACGHSPICQETNRLVKAGVSVVVSAGNGGYGSYITASSKSEAKFNDLSITDPGNADLAVTVGSTHREMPHTYGVSYFSSRGPTGDGRMKPDLLAPGERILSCAAGVEAEKFTGSDPDAPPVLYSEQSGTSMAAPHVSGAIAAFLSVRGEFIGKPERVKSLLLANAIDLGRDRSFQGAGLLDLMKVLQAV